jgi:hypothetical protein
MTEREMRAPTDVYVKWLRDEIAWLRSRLQAAEKERDDLRRQVECWVAWNEQKQETK